MVPSSNGRTVASISYTRIVLVDVRPEKYCVEYFEHTHPPGQLG
jgi:hypothetical protein